MLVQAAIGIYCRTLRRIKVLFLLVVQLKLSAAHSSDKVALTNPSIYKICNVAPMTWIFLNVDQAAGVKLNVTMDRTLVYAATSKRKDVRNVSAANR